MTPSGTDGRTNGGLPWQRSREPSSHAGSVVDPGWLSRDAVAVARDLLGCRLRSSVGARTVTGVIVETEAYLGPADPASHAATRTGITDRNRLMFGPAGRLYVYRIYGMHWCLNVVTGEEGRGQAVLIRGLEPLSGVPVMEERREGRMPLAAGPGRLSQALGADGSLHGHDLARAPLELLHGWGVDEGRVETTGRVGVSQAPEWPLRFLVRGSPGVSRARAHPGDGAGMPPLDLLNR